MATTGSRALPPVMSCTNTKALLDHTTFPAWADALRAEAPALSRAGFLALLPGPLLDSAARAFAGTGIGWGAQDVWPDSSPPTGELPAEALAHAGCQAVMCGHHERRRRLGESDTDVAGKAAAAAGQDLVPVVCVGEREEGPAARVVTAVLDQAAPVLETLPADAPLVWLYEPAWTGGAGAPAPYPQIAEVTAALRERCAGRTGDTRVLYGGAVTPGVLTRALAAGAGLDGVGIGRAAHDPARRAAVTAELLDLLASREEAAAPDPRKAPT
ncbi:MULTISPECIES: triose-phosphate isomerase [unclassified Streptomyces]|uniref:triose-phosphate isomerase n=1 Tax=unclassified Streptomyces TaxID=2593676 RepID=UPI0003672C11|nr:triose-phosphate isomerase family protein [Streptomyces sp. LaPpAH-202]MYW61672.1 triosephosphate isomerase [Streptomyces sp. SID8370]MYW85471.1 triosephosphate isomerase [Streptomyces sp. SID8371]